MAIDIHELKTARMPVFATKGKIDSNRRVLIIGLGGTGTDTLLQVKATITERFHLPTDKTTGETVLPKNIQLLAIDTDQGILEKNIHGVRIDKSDLLLLQDPNIAEALANKEQKMPRFYNDWVNPSLTAPMGGTIGVFGAGAIRQLGRYLLVSNYKNVYNKITSDLKNIMLGAPGGAINDIIILSGISGGTGSGTFIDMGYICRKVAEDLFVDSCTQITAYLYLPDVNLANPGVTGEIAKKIKINGYAALKDLDYFMSNSEKSKVNDGALRKYFKFFQKYDHNTTIESEKPPFDSTYLVSGITNPAHPNSDAYDYAINVSADSIVNFITGVGTTDHDNMGPGIAAVDINGAAIETVVNPIKDTQGRDINANYKYKTIGISVAALPMEAITDFIAAELLKKVQLLKDNGGAVQQKDYDDFRKGTGISGIVNAVKKHVGGFSTNITGKAMKGDAANTDSALIAQMKKFENKVSTDIPTYAQNVIHNTIEQTEQNLDIMFTNIAKGPFCVNRILADPKNGYIGYLRSAAAKLRTQAQKSESAAVECDRNAKELLDKAKKKVVFAEGAFQDYIDERIAQVDHSVDAKIRRELADRIDAAKGIAHNNRTFVDEMQDKNDSLFNVYTTILNTLAQKFATAATVAKGHTGTGYMWELVNTKTVDQDIKDALAGVNLDVSLNNLLKDMVDESQKWCKSGRSAVKKFGKFLEGEFQPILARSMDDYVKLLPDFNNEITKLDTLAENKFPVNNAIPGGTAGKLFDRVIIPDGAPFAAGSVQKYLDTKYGQDVLKPCMGNLYEKLTWIRVSTAVPIFEYLYLTDCEKEYVNAPAAAKIGLHLYENTGVIGESYPGLLPEDFTKFKDLCQSKHKESDKLFDEARKFGVVGTNNSGVYIGTTDPDWARDEMNNIKAKYTGLDLGDILKSRLSDTDIISCVKDLTAAGGASVKKGELVLPNTTGVDLSNETGEFYAKDSFFKMPEAQRLAEEEIAKLKCFDDAKTKLNELQAVLKDEKKIYLDFAAALIYKIIAVKGAKIVYKHGDETMELSNKMNNRLWLFETFFAFEKGIYTNEGAAIGELVNAAMDDNDKLRELYNGYCSIEKDINSALPFLDGSNADAQVFYDKFGILMSNEIGSFKTAFGF